MTSLLLLGAALAAPAHVHPTADTLTKQSLTESVWEHFDPATASPSLVDRFACGTGVVQQLKDNWDWFTPEERAELTNLVAPFKEDLLQALPANPPPPPGEFPEGTCWEQMGTYRHATDHFAVEWDGSNIEESDIEDFGEALETAWSNQVEELGWRQPHKSDEYKVMVYVDSSNYAGAYTSVEVCSGSQLAYIVTGNGIFWGDWYQDLAAHEFNHAIQFAYGYAHEFYFWESTATYIEEQTYPSHNAWAPYIAGYTANPWIAMNASSQQSQDIFSHMYAMAILNFYLDEYVGGHDLIRELWEYSERFPMDVYNLYLPDALESLDHDWNEIYTGFIAANTVMDYEEGNRMGRVERMDWFDELPVNSANSERVTRPESLGQNFWRLNGDAADSDEPDLVLLFEGELDGEWLVLLVGTTDDRVQRIVTAEAVDGDDDVETYEALMTDWGQHEDVWVVMSPTTRSDEDFSYVFDLWAEAPPVEETAPEEEAEEGTRLPIVGSCSTSPLAPRPAWLWLALAGLVVRRQR